MKAKNNFELCFGPTRSWEVQEAFIRRVKRCLLINIAPLLFEKTSVGDALLFVLDYFVPAT